MAADLLHAPRLSVLLAIGLPQLVLTSWNFYQCGVLTGLEAYRETTTANALSAALTFPLIVVGVWLAGVEGAIVAQTVSVAASCGVFQYWIRRAGRETGIPRISTRHVSTRKFLLHAGLPAVFLSAINAPTDWLAFAIVARQPDGTSEIGIFSLCNQWCLMLRFLPLMMGTAMLPMAARTAASRSANEDRLLLTMGLRASALACVPFAMAVIIASPFVMRCYGPDMVQHSNVLVILALCGIGIAIQSTSERFLVSLDAVWSSFCLSAARSALLLLLLLSLSHGAAGLAIARLAAFTASALACTALAFYLIRRRDRSSCDPAVKTLTTGRPVCAGIRTIEAA
jgi:O-antigen/teichoic acid export membrane protein